MSDNTIQCHISDLTSDVKEQVLDSVYENPFSILLDKSTHDANGVFVIYYIKELAVQEEFLFFHSLPASTTAEEIFRALNDFIQESHIDRGHCCGACNDCSRALIGRHSVLVKWGQAVAVWKHCIIHCQALATKKNAKELCMVLDEVVKIVNLIKSCAMNARLFSISPMGSLFQHLHSEFRWLSWGKVFTRLCDLHEEVPP